MGCIYLLTSPSGKQYVGQTSKTLEERWNGHMTDARFGSPFALHRAIRKYGAAAFTLEVLHDGIDDKTVLDALEVQEIKNNGTLSPQGYNMTEGGGGGKMSLLVAERHRASVNAEACRRAKSDAARQLWQNPLHRARRLQKMRALASELGHNRPWLNKVREAAKRPERNAQISKKLRATKVTRVPSLIIEGQIFGNVRLAHEALKIGRATIQWRCNNLTSPRFKAWRYLPHHGDPECDAVEEVFAIIQWAEENPGHNNLPDWAREIGAQAA
ncbi:GIY-YIG nuclease family protein [Acidimangrovimonas sediminis]|uniref:GIY-YIG nuclease family protein n=1 Tax=Acidimangrovimonas sediminis TaxID=2056283 RepID=UPI000C802BCC|nr:GIY-YIG nuclease family protein [Acidimangrovimonas sediminis]